MKIRRWHVRPSKIATHIGLTINVMGEKAWYTWDDDLLNVVQFPSVRYAESRILTYELDDRIDWQDEIETEDHQ